MVETKRGGARRPITARLRSVDERPRPDKPLAKRTVVRCVQIVLVDAVTGPRRVDHPPAAQADADVGDAFAAGFTAEEQEVAGLDRALDGPADRELQPGVAGERVARQLVAKLCQTRAVDAAGR